MKNLIFLSCALAPLMKSTDGNPDGGGASDHLEPEARMILQRIGETKAEMEKINKTLEEHEETKKFVQEHHEAIKSFDGLTSDIKNVIEKSAKLEARLAEVRREVSGDPLKRLTQDAEMRHLITSVAKATYLRGKNLPIPKEIEESAARMQEVISGKALLGSASPGSTYIDTELLGNVYQLAANHGKWSMFDLFRPGARTVNMPVDTTDPDMVWMTEGTAPSEASYSGSTVTLNIKDLFGWVGVSNSLLEDDEIGLANHLMNKFTRATAKKLDHAIFSADGTDDATHGNYEGIFTFGTAYDLSATEDTIAEVDFEDFIGLLAGADAALLDSPTSRWFCHPSILVQLLAIKDSNGRPIFLTAIEAPSAAGLGSILGYPVITANQCPSTVAAEAPIIAFGDTMAMAVAIRKDMEFAASTEALFTANKTTFRQICRAGTKIKLATAFEVMTLGTAS